jgi:ketosteroid isomerase-like protein
MGRASEAALEYFRCVREQDAEGIGALFAPDAVVVLPNGTVMRGIDEVRTFFENVAFANAIQPHPGVPIESGDRCAVEITVGEDDSPSVADVFVVDGGGRVSELRIYTGR